MLKVAALPPNLRLDDLAGLDAPGADLAADYGAPLVNPDFLEVGREFAPGDAGGVQADPALGLGQAAAGDDVAGVQSFSADVAFSWHFIPLLFNKSI